MTSLSPNKQALLALKQMQQKLADLEQAKYEPIAVVGMGCRFPGGNNPDAYWQLLENNVDAITEVPPQHWDAKAYYDPNPSASGKICTPCGGFVPNLQEFDASFFRIAPREAISLDPQQRLLLEVTWEALENAAISADTLQGSQTGVFIGICGIDYWHQLLNRNQTTIDAYLTTGNTHSLASGRLSYFLGLTGPSISVDTACSSSLVAVHLAIQSLRQKECNLAIAGGVNRIVSPQASINFSQARMLSPQGRCHTFDAAANGFVRAEGCGVLVLKRLSDALKDRDRILALLKGSAVNQDGRTSGITAPSSLSQQAVIRQALANSRVEAQDINYIETHGTGTALGDVIEVEALSAVFTSPIILGAVKTNIGHTEGASGIASLIKVILALEHETIPGNLHFNQPNPQINWQKLPFKLPLKNTSWSKSENPRLAGVSAFGFSGTNAHVIVQEVDGETGDKETRETRGQGRQADRETRETRETRKQGRDDFNLEQSQEYLFTLSATTEKALEDLIRRYQQYLIHSSSLNPHPSIKNICLTTNTGRSHFKYRLAIITESVSDLQQKLEAIINNQRPLQTWQGKANLSNDEPVIFYFPEISSYDAQTLQYLYQTQPHFRDAIAQCGEILQSFLDKSLLEILFGETGGQEDKGDKGERKTRERERQEIKEIDGRKDTQAVLFSLQYALAKLWQCWGIQPDQVAGNGIGEYVAACVAGVFNLQDALPLILTLEDDPTTIASQINYNNPQVPLISTVTGTNISDRVTNFNYWGDRFLSTVNNSGNWQQENNYYLKIEPLSNWQEILANLAQLYILGVKIDCKQFLGNIKYQKLSLPTYPFQRQKYWY